MLDGSSSTAPTIFNRCTFIGNTARGTGGAMEISSGISVLTNNMFEGNTAGVGGALRLGGTLSLDNCSFVENSSNEAGGPAVSNIGFLKDFSNSSFANNVFLCAPGMFLDFIKVN